MNVNPKKLILAVLMAGVFALIGTVAFTKVAAQVSAARAAL